MSSEDTPAEIAVIDELIRRYGALFDKPENIRSLMMLAYHEGAVAGAREMGERLTSTFAKVG
jgi:hypothetical protein